MLLVGALQLVAEDRQWQHLGFWCQVPCLYDKTLGITGYHKGIRLAVVVGAVVVVVAVIVVAAAALHDSG